MKPCERCGGPLPTGCRAHRRFCDGCRRERAREYHREYQRDPAHREYQREYQRAYRCDPANRERDLARRRDSAYREREREYQRKRWLAEVAAKRDAMALDPAEIARRLQEVGVPQHRGLPVTLVGTPSAESDAAIARSFAAFLEAERPGTTWRVVA